MWHILSMGNNSDFTGYYKYYTVYSGEHLWSLIPITMRYWWIDAVKRIFHESGSPYENVTIHHPVPIFIDKTIDSNQFRDDFDSQQLSRVVKAMDNHNIMNMNSLCPWGCSTSVLQSGKIPMDLMFQKILPKVVIKMYTDKKI